MGKEITSYVKRHLVKYPKMETIDIFKLLYQETFLTGHIINDKSLQYLNNEINDLGDYSNLELYEYIANGEIRINIKPYLKYHDVNSLYEIVLNSSKEEITKDIFTEVKYCKDAFLGDSRILSSLLYINIYNNLYPTHSNIYKKYYNPHYRLATTNNLRIDLRVIKLQSFIDKLSKENNERIIIACEGKCGSGKSTITSKLKNVTVIHIDDFFSPNKDERLDFKRVIDCLKQIKTSNQLEYKAYDCTNKEYVKRKYDLDKIVILEGVYSYDALLREYIDYLVYFVITKKLQHERLQKRETQAKLELFNKIWIPREEEYYKTFDFIVNSDILI